MSKSIRIVICICGVIAAFSVSKAQGWRGIVPLHSTRADVERLIGSPMETNGITYDLKSERVNVVYSNGSCKTGKAEWNVPSDTVIGMTIYPQTKLMLSDLRIDLNNFEKFIDPRNPNSVSYSNQQEGIGIVTRSNRTVIVIEYFPAAKDKHLRCRHVSHNQLSNDEMEYYKFDEYADISFTDEKARLDNFANYLHQEPKLTGYIIVYAGGQACAGVARANAERAKNYLVNMCGLDSKRIVAIDGEPRKKSVVALYLLPPSVPLPISHPTRSNETIIKNEGSKKNKRNLSHAPCNYNGN
jgi:hypothetical protein